MTRCISWLTGCAFAVLAFSLAVSIAVAQPPAGQRGPMGPGGGGPGMGGPGGGPGMGGALMVLRDERVQQELKITDEQRTQLREMSGKLMSQARGDFSEESRQKMADEVDASLEKILNGEQFLRLKQIELQAAGTRALADPDVAEALKLTDEQKQQLSELRDQLNSEMRSGGGAGGSREAAMQRIMELRRKAEARVNEILTPEQQKQLEEMKGKPFEFRPMGEGGGYRGGQSGGQEGRGGFDPMQLDRNSDGKISKEEAPERMQQFFDRLDTNGDGAIDKAEMDAMRSRMGRGPRDGEGGGQRGPRDGEGGGQRGPRDGEGGGYRRGGGDRGGNGGGNRDPRV